jgi:photosynthetic reaction center cytochrome c subunit
MVQVYNPRTVASQSDVNAMPELAPPARVRKDGPIAGGTYQNVQVLRDLSLAEFGRTMNAISGWIAPQQSCTYCHVEGDFASDDKYTKVVARRMLQMTRHVNSTWRGHVAQTGVTCYTCHRGQPLPAERWFTLSPPDLHGNFLGGMKNQNAPEQTAGLASLPNGAYTKYLVSETGSQEIRVAGTTALRTDHKASIQDTESTYSLMIHISKSLGVNCTYCHNSRAFANWPQSSPQRVTAWYGIRMVRDLNTQFLEPLGGSFPMVPEGRLGPLKDAAKVNCATCHRGSFKPLYGAQMAKHFPALFEGSDSGAPTPEAQLTHNVSTPVAAPVN